MQVLSVNKQCWFLDGVTEDSEPICSEQDIDTCPDQATACSPEDCADGGTQNAHRTVRVSWHRQSCKHVSDFGYDRQRLLDTSYPSLGR